MSSAASIQPLNVVRLRGRVTQPPDLRSLPSGDEVVSLNLTVDRDEDTRDTLPVQLGPVPPRGRRPNPGQPGRRLLRIAQRLGPGDLVEVDGWLRRRWWDTAAGRRSRIEVAATDLRVVANVPAPAG